MTYVDRLHLGRAPAQRRRVPEPRGQVVDRARLVGSHRLALRSALGAAVLHELLRVEMRAAVVQLLIVVKVLHDLLWRIRVRTGRVRF